LNNAEAQKIIEALNLTTDGYGSKAVNLFGSGLILSQTVITTWFIMLVLILFAVFARRRMDRIPKGVQNFMEMLVEAIYNLTKQTMGNENAGFAPYVGTLLLFIGISNISGLFGIRPPTSDLNTTFALAIMTFCMTHYFGVKNKGFGYLKGFLEPFPLLLPMNIIGELANPISLSFRLFGNILGGLIIMNLLYGALGMWGLIPVPAVLHVYFDVFAGLLQSFIFTMLTMVFVSMAMD